MLAMLIILSVRNEKRKMRGYGIMVWYIPYICSRIRSIYIFTHKSVIEKGQTLDFRDPSKQKLAHFSRSDCLNSCRIRVGLSFTPIIRKPLPLCRVGTVNGDITQFLFLFFSFFVMLLCTLRRQHHCCQRSTFDKPHIHRRKIRSLHLHDYVPICLCVFSCSNCSNSVTGINFI